jgi:hypothetical protein
MKILLDLEINGSVTEMTGIDTGPLKKKPPLE